MRITPAYVNHKKPTQQSFTSSKMSSLCIFMVLLSASLPHLSAANANRVRYDTLGTKSYTGRDCTEEWCGEQWKSNRILYYNLTLNSTLVVENRTDISTHHMCENGVTLSSDCKQTESVETTELTSVRKVSLHRTSEDPIKIVTDSPELDHHYLLSDNMELAKGGPTLISDLYPANQTKIWQVKIPKKCKMFVSFLHFNIESSDKCEHDYFSVQTSKDPNEVVVFCNSLQNIDIRYRRRVQFTLHSDHASNNGQLAASVCLSKMDSEKTKCDCFESTRRKRSAQKLSADNDRQLTMDRRLEALERLRNRRINSS